MQVLADQAHSAKSVDDGHPGAAHRRDVQALVDLFVVVVEVQARGAVVELVRLGCVAEAAGEHGVYTGRQRAFVHGQGLVKVKVLLERFDGRAVFKKEHALQRVGLLDVGRTQDAVPAPLLVDGALCRVELGHRNQFLVQKSVLLQEHLVSPAVRVVHVAANGFPLLEFVGVEVHLGAQRGVFLGLILSQVLGAFSRVLEAPGGHEVRVVVVVDVVLVLVGSGYAQDDELLFVVAPVHALGPEPGDGDEYFESALSQVSVVAGVAQVGVDSV